ncbi:MAG: pantoate--beta-alanine ligase [Chthoniobacterales bacterium]
MEIHENVAAVRARDRSSGKRKLLVPTMGALHDGHKELIRVAREAATPEGEVSVSIFVNPLQFEAGSDFDRYPRPEQGDEELCRQAGVDVIFRPTPDEMYRVDRSVFVEETNLSNRLCGRSRPGHFRGVCTVVTKLFHILTPDAAVFGEKDFQQLAIIRRLVRDLAFGIEIIGVPTVREPNGLACSSRNKFLNADERSQSTVLRAGLLAARDAAREGEGSGPRILEIVRAQIESAPLARIDYVELVDAETFEPRETIKGGSLIALAVFFGPTRLIDNIRLP